MFRRLVATSRAPQIMVLSILRSFGKIGPQIDQIWAWLSRGHRWSPGVRNPLKSLVTGPSLLVNCYLEIKFHKIIRVNPPLKRINFPMRLMTSLRRLRIFFQKNHAKPSQTLSIVMTRMFGRLQSSFSFSCRYILYIYLRISTNSVFIFQ